MDMRSPGLGSAVLLVDLALGEILDVERAQCRRRALRQHRLGTLRLAPGLAPLALPGELLGQCQRAVADPPDTAVGDRQLPPRRRPVVLRLEDRKSTRLNSSH